MEQLLSIEWVAKTLAILVGLEIALRGLAEGLTRIAEHTSAKWDNQAAKYLSQAAWALGAFLGKFGYGVPKCVLKEEINAAKADKDK